MVCARLFTFDYCLGICVLTWVGCLCCWFRCFVGFGLSRDVCAACDLCGFPFGRLFARLVSVVYDLSFRLWVLCGLGLPFGVFDDWVDLLWFA